MTVHSSAIPRHTHPFRAETPQLDASAFAGVVANAPLVAIDLVVEDEQGAVLLGLRNNPPARGYWFVPGGRIRKNETLDQAFARISATELGHGFPRGASRLADVHEHMYDTNFLGQPGVETHYIVLVHRLQARRDALPLPVGQHSRYAWMQPDQLLAHAGVHPYVKAYFKNELNKSGASQ